MKDLVNILIVDDQVAKARLNGHVQDYFDDHLKEGNYPFSVKVLDEKIINQERLWNYLADETKTPPDFILLDWAFFNEGDVANDTFTGEIILQKIMNEKKIAFSHKENDKQNEWQKKLYKNMEVIAFSAYTDMPKMKNFKKMLKDGCIAAVSKDTIVSGISEERDDAFLINYIKKWLALKEYGEEPQPAYDGTAELDSDFIYEWHSFREVIKDKRQGVIKIEKETSFEKTTNFEFFKKIVLGETIDSIKDHGFPHANQYKNKTKEKLLDEVVKNIETRDFRDIETGDVHTWFHIALEKEYPFVIDYLKRKGFTKK